MALLFLCFYVRTFIIASDYSNNYYNEKVLVYG